LGSPCSQLKDIGHQCGERSFFVATFDVNILLKRLAEYFSAYNYNYVKIIAFRSKVSISNYFKLNLLLRSYGSKSLNYKEYEILEIIFVATFRMLLAKCGEWRQGFTPLT
jgi:hypothetical protein